MLGAWSIVHSTESMVGAFFTAALAEHLALHGKRVLLFDLNASSPAIDVYLGVSERVVYTLSDALRVSPEDAVLSPQENLFFVPIGVGDGVDTVAPIAACIDSVSPDVVLLSAPRSALPLAASVSDGLLLLTDASFVSLRAASALASAHAFSGFVLNDLVLEKEALRKMPALTALSDAIGLPLVGILPHVDTNNPQTVAGKDFLSATENVAGRLLGESIPLLRGISLEGMRKRAFFERASHG